jgi:hypothetical protein
MAKNRPLLARYRMDSAPTSTGSITVRSGKKALPQSKQSLKPKQTTAFSKITHNQAKYRKNTGGFCAF